MIGSIRTTPHEPRRLSSPFLFALAGVLLASDPAGADLLSRPAPMQGYYVGVGALGAMTWVHTDKTDGLPPFYGAGGTLQVGQGLTDRLAIGLDVGATFNIDSGRFATLGHLGIALKWRFFDHLFARPMAAFGFADVTRREKGLEKIVPSVTGSYGLAIGYDYFAWKRANGSGGLAISPVVWGRFNNAATLLAFQWGVGVELTWWSGLPKNQLDLPVEEAFDSGSP